MGVPKRTNKEMLKFWIWRKSYQNKVEKWESERVEQWGTGTVGELPEGDTVCTWRVATRCSQRSWRTPSYSQHCPIRIDKKSINLGERRERKQWGWESTDYLRWAHRSFEEQSNAFSLCHGQEKRHEKSHEFPFSLHLKNLSRYLSSFLSFQPIAVHLLDIEINVLK